MARFVVAGHAVSPQVYIFSEILGRMTRRDCAVGRRARDISDLVRDSVSTITATSRPNERLEGRELGAHDLLRLLEHLDATKPGLLKTLGLGGHPDGLAATLKQFMKCAVSKTDLLVAVFAQCLCTRGFPAGWLSAALRRCREVDQGSRHLHDGRRVPAAALVRYVSDRPRDRRGLAGQHTCRSSAKRSVRHFAKRAGRRHEMVTSLVTSLGPSRSPDRRLPLRRSTRRASPRRLRYEV